MIKLSDRMYEVLKWFCVILIPSLITFLSAVLIPLGVSSEITNVITLVIGAIGTFVGSIIGISTYNYNAEKEGE